MTVQEATQLGISYLTEGALSDPVLDTQLILSAILDCNRAHLLAHPGTSLTPRQTARFRQWLVKRGEGYPLQYLRGIQEFFGRNFHVNPAVFIPRPETELLIEVSLDWLKTQVQNEIRVLDVGTGCGCIAATLAKEDRRVHVTAIDVSARALKVALHNCRTLDCVEQINLRQGTGLNPVQHFRHYFHLIVSNPPYVANHEQVAPSVIKYEPLQAIFSGQSRLKFYSLLFEEAKPILAPNGLLVVELAYQARIRVSRLAERDGWTTLGVYQDLSGIERCATFQQKDSPVTSGDPVW